MRTVYICHPYSNDPEYNAATCLEICRRIFAADVGILPIAPQCYLPAFVDEATARDRAMMACVEMMMMCDEVWAFGSVLTDGMRQELYKAANSPKGQHIVFYKNIAELDESLAVRVSNLPKRTPSDI